MPELLCPSLVGRGAQLARLVSVLGTGGTVMVVGEAGIGKSALVREAARVASPATLLSGRSAPGPVSALRPLSEVALDAVRAGADLSADNLRLFRRALGALLPSLPASQAQPATQARSASPPEPGLVTGPFGLVVAEALLELVRELPGPVAMVLEDLHWADPATVGAVEHMADQAAARGLALVATLRPEPGAAAVGLARRLADRRTAELIELGPLDAAESAAMIGACLRSTALPEGLAARVGMLAEGRPLLIEELLRATAECGHLRQEGGEWLFEGRVVTAVPRTIEEAVGQRVASLTPGQRQVVRAAAVLGREADVALLAGVAGLGGDELAAALRAGTQAQLFDPAAPGSDLVRFRHALTRDAVLGALAPGERAQLARRALAVIDASPALVGQESWTSVAAGVAVEAGDSRRAARCLLDAGRGATATGALGPAVELLESARSHAHGDPGLAAEVEEGLVIALALAGEVDRAVEVGGHLRTLLHGTGAGADRMAEVELALARAYASTERWDEAAAGLARAGPTARAARFTSLDALVKLGRDDHAGAEAAAQAAVVMSADEDDPAAACEAFEVLGRLARRTDLDAAAGWFSRAVVTAEKAGLAVWRARALHELATIAQLRHVSVTELEQARESAVDAGAFGLLAAVDFHLAAVHGVRFEVTESLAAARRCLDLSRRLGARRPGARRQTAMAWMLVAHAHAYAGRRAQVEAAANEALSMAGDDPEVVGMTWACRGLASLLLEERDRAMDELDRSVTWLRTLVGGPGPVPPWYVWPLLATLERTDGPAVLAETGGSAVCAANGPAGMWHLACAVAAGRGGRSGEAEAALSRAEESFAPAHGFAGYRHLGLRLAAESAVADGWGQPDGWLVEAETYFAARGLDRGAGACRSLLRRAGVPQRRRGRGDSAVPASLARLGVTSREVDVLRLLACGLTNKEIANRLFVAPRTVKGHLENLFTKTGRSSRSELASVAVAEGVAEVAALSLRLSLRGRS